MRWTVCQGGSKSRAYSICYNEVSKPPTSRPRICQMTRSTGRILVIRAGEKWASVMSKQESEPASIQEQDLSSVLTPVVRAFLRQEYHLVHENLPRWLKVLSEVGASECWHKKSTFKAHLFEVNPACYCSIKADVQEMVLLGLKTYKMCKLWGFSDMLCETMLFHSAYSNSYVNLAVFRESADRPRLAGLVGQRVEELIHVFCIIPRHDLIYEQLLKPGLQVVPRQGVVVRHIHTGEPLRLPQRVVAAFLALTMVDFSEQLMSWQDTMFENTDGKLYFAGHTARVLWPAAMKPGLYHSALSRMGQLLRNTLDDMQQGQQQGEPAAVSSNGHGDDVECTDAFEDLQLSLPAVYNHCSVLVSEVAERQCRDLYWDVVCNKNEPQHAEEAEEKLHEACQLNPHVAESSLLLAQLLLQKGDFDAARAAASRGLRLLCEWGTAWDKRMAWDAWVAWARVLLRAANTDKWVPPDQPMGMLNLGLVDL